MLRLKRRKEINGCNVRVIRIMRTTRTCITTYILDIPIAHCIWQNPLTSKFDIENEIKRIDMTWVHFTYTIFGYLDIPIGYY